VKRVLVTGAAGYVGSHACKALARSGFEPIGLDSLERAGFRELPWAPLEVVNTADCKGVTRLIEKYSPTAVVHFAAYAYVGESVANPSLYYRNNVCGSIILVDALRAAGINNFVFSSSCATYGIPQAVPIDEDHPQKPVNPYGSSKLMVERMLRDFDLAYGFRSVALRYFNAAGADPECEVGECHDPETHAIPLAIRTALGEQAVFEIYGTDYPTPDGTAIRDYVHVMDLARAHVRALEYLLDGGKSAALNLGTGVGHSVKEVVKAVETVTGREVKTRPSPRRDGDPPVLIANPGRANQVLRWTAEMAGLTDIVRTAVQWHRKWRSARAAAECADA
jgi:UDP-glucose-4-epimerase GalE